ncbi:MAG: VOC family protein [Verrucomicrobiota bacterium]
MSEIPEPTVTVSLTVKDAGAALDFYVKALGANELFRLATPDGTVMHGEFMLGNTHMYVSSEFPQWEAFAPAEGSLCPNLLAINTEDCDAAFKVAVDAGGTVILEPEDQFWGKRTALLKDPFGYRWCIRQHIEDVSPEEMMNRAKAAMGV